METPLALRFDPRVLAAARECARLDNRSLTNFIETALRRRTTEMTPDAAAGGQFVDGQIKGVPRDL